MSATLENPEWSNTTVLRGDLEEEVGELKQRFTGDVLVAGSGQLVRSLLAHDLVDELRLMVFPVILGAGKRLFADGVERQPFRIVDSRQTGEVVVVTLQRAAEGSAES